LESLFSPITRVEMALVFMRLVPVRSFSQGLGFFSVFHFAVIFSATVYEAFTFSASDVFRAIKTLFFFPTPLVLGPLVSRGGPLLPDVFLFLLLDFLGSFF